MSAKEPVLLTVLIDTQAYQWYAGGIDRDGHSTPLICSQQGNLDEYLGQPFDEQVSFLRHRLSGVLQRGCDRLWRREQKPAQIVFVADGLFPDAAEELTQRVAEHFVEWMTSPPVVFFVWGNAATSDAPALTQLAGELSDEDRQALVTGLPELSRARSDATAWEVIPKPPKS